MRFLGAKVVLTPRTQKSLGMNKKAVVLAEANGCFQAHQFETKDNADIHENTTACEIITDFAGESLDYWLWHRWNCHLGSLRATQGTPRN
jgi:cysteine synthase A